MIRRVITLVTIISMITIMTGCKANESNVMENEQSTDISSNKEILDETIKNRSQGNSIQNILNGGLIAYDNKYIYYNEGDFSKESTIYQKNIETSEIKEIVKERGIYLNIYEDYLYYVSSVGAMTPVNEIIRVKTDGTEREVVVSKDENIAHTSVQIIGDFLYYAINIDGDNDSATKMDLMKLNLKTLEKNKIETLDKGEIISVDNNGTSIDTYLKQYIPEKGQLITQKIEHKEVEDLFGNFVWHIGFIDIELILGIYDDEMYYVKTRNNFEDLCTIEKKSTIEDIYSETNEIYSDKDLFIESALIGKDGIYFVDYENYLNKLDFNTKEIEIIKEVDLRKHISQRDDFALKLFEVNGDLAYYNSLGELIIDSSINIINSDENYVATDNSISNNLDNKIEGDILEENLDYGEFEDLRVYKDRFMSEDYITPEEEFKYIKKSLNGIRYSKEKIIFSEKYLKLLSRVADKILSTTSEDMLIMFNNDRIVQTWKAQMDEITSANLNLNRTVLWLSIGNVNIEEAKDYGAHLVHSSEMKILLNLDGKTVTDELYYVLQEAISEFSKEEWQELVNRAYDGEEVIMDVEGIRVRIEYEYGGINISISAVELYE
ncbi:DUF5050 domain-containing protein [Clostridium celatum]|uniref:DUF5050 domain-containing protein n=1 Tax=Clostridium celatum TaxID=36834 RepID=UPI001896A643|nr:DUF5050 domain-containing protein [Clostridium celatum]